MRIFTVVTVILILTTGAVRAQMDVPNDTTVTAVSETDVHWKIVQKEIEQITKGAPDSPIGNKLEMVGRIEGWAIRELFPGWEFYAVSYSNYKKEGFDDRPVSLAAGLGLTLAVGPDSRLNIRMSHYGNHEEYGHLLIETKAAIRNTDDANLVWHAFCEIHRKAWKGRTVEKVSETEWKLGIYSYDQTVSVVDGLSTIVKRTHFMQVTTDATSKQITSWKSVVETSNNRLRRTEG
jgi:hypothetical protein